MTKLTTKIAISTSVLVASSLPFLLSSCSSDEDTPRMVTTAQGNTIPQEEIVYVDADMSQLVEGKIKPISERTYQLLSSFSQTRSISNDELEAYYLYDKVSEKSATVIPNPSAQKSWVYECYGKDSDTPVIMIFEEVGKDSFVIKDEEGTIVRSFTYNSDLNELWTYEPQVQSRALSSRDQFLCGTAFTAACFVTCSALAVPTGGASLAVSLGFFAISSYVCG